MPYDSSKLALTVSAYESQRLGRGIRAVAMSVILVDAFVVSMMLADRVANSLVDGAMAIPVSGLLGGAAGYGIGLVASRWCRR